MAAYLEQYQNVVDFIKHNGVVAQSETIPD
jgi:hypothetical protein